MQSDLTAHVAAQTRPMRTVCAAAARCLEMPPRDTASGTTPTWPPASGCVVCTLYNTQPEDFSSCNPNQGDPLINPEGHRRGTCRRPARTQGWQAPRWLVSQDCSQDGTSQRDGDEGRQPPTLIPAEPPLIAQESNSKKIDSELPKQICT